MTRFFNFDHIELRRLGAPPLPFETESKPSNLGLGPIVTLVRWVSLSMVFDAMELCATLAGIWNWCLEGSVTERCGGWGDVERATGTKSLMSFRFPPKLLRPPFPPPADRVVPCG